MSVALRECMMAGLLAVLKAGEMAEMKADDLDVDSVERKALQSAEMKVGL